MQKLYPLAFALLLVTSAASAQQRLRGGPLLGATLSSARYTPPSSSAGAETNSTYRLGLAIGLMGSLETSRFAFQPGIQFCQVGYEIQSGNAGQSGTNNVRLDYVQFPLTVAYLTREDGEGLRLLAGGYASLLTGGVQKVRNPFFSATRSVATADPNPGIYSSLSPHLVKKADAGLLVGLGFLYQHCLLQATYSFGLVNVETGNVTAYNHGLQASVGYLFGQ